MLKKYFEDKFSDPNAALEDMYQILSKDLLEGLKDPTFNISEHALDFYYQTIGEYSNHTAENISGNLKERYGNFLALFIGVISGLFEDDGIVLGNYGNLLVKYLSIFNNIYGHLDKTGIRIRPTFMQNLDQLFTIPGEEVSLIDVSYLYTLNDLSDFQNPSTVLYLEEFQSVSPYVKINGTHFKFNEGLWPKAGFDPPPVHVTLKKSFYDCANIYIKKMNLHYQIGKGYYDEVSMPENRFGNFSSPCENLDVYSTCSEYCKWHKKFFEDWKREDFLTMMKFATPQRRILLKPSTPDKERKLAEKLFGTENIKTLKTTIAPKFLVVFCHDVAEGYLGDDAGLSLKFCNDFFPAPTDIGMCLTRNMDIKNVLNENQYFETLFEANLQHHPENIEGGTAWGDITLVLMTDNDKDNFLKKSYSKTSDVNLDEIEFQLHDSNELGKFFKGREYDKELTSLKLKANTEYFIDVTPTGHVTSDEFKDLSFEDRNCFFEGETAASQTFKSNNQGNCLYDCLVLLAKKQCKCLPWDYISNSEDNEQVQWFSICI